MTMQKPQIPMYSRPKFAGITGGVAYRVRYLGSVDNQTLEIGTIGLLEPVELSNNGDVIKAVFYPENSSGYCGVSWPKFEAVSKQSLEYEPEEPIVTPEFMAKAKAKAELMKEFKNLPNDETAEGKADGLIAAIEEPDETVDPATRAIGIIATAIEEIEAGYDGSSPADKLSAINELKGLRLAKRIIESEIAISKF